jgi:hypothetical protein
MGVGGRLGTGLGVDGVLLLLPSVFDLAEESGAQEGVGLLDVGQVNGQKLSPDFEGSILI